MDTNERIRKFRRGCAMLIDAPNGYEWGKESLDGADCSGVVCHGLICAGYNIRCTANEIFQKLVYDVTRRHQYLLWDQGMFVAMVVRETTTTAGLHPECIEYECIHIAPFISDNMLVNANSEDDRIELISFDKYVIMYGKDDTTIQIGDFLQTSLGVQSGKLYYGPDKLLEEGGINYERI